MCVLRNRFDGSDWHPKKRHNQFMDTNSADMEEPQAAQERLLTLSTSMPSCTRSQCDELRWNTVQCMFLVFSPMWQSFEIGSNSPSVMQMKAVITYGGWDNEHMHTNVQVGRTDLAQFICSVQHHASQSPSDVAVKRYDAGCLEAVLDLKILKDLLALPGCLDLWR